MGERAQWDAACHARKDCGCSPRASDDPTGQSHSGKPLGAHWQASRGLGMACATLSGHVEPSSLKKQHRKALRLAGVRPFVLYSLRHTFLTRLGESGCDAWTLARIAGHSSIAISSRYVHPSEDAVSMPCRELGGHKTGHSVEWDGETATKALLSA